MSQKIEELLDQIKTLISELNTRLKDLSDDEKRQNKYQDRYYFGGSSSPQMGMGFQSIIPANERHKANRIFRADIDYVEYRKRLRSQKVSAVDIWRRFPPRNTEEAYEMETEVARYKETQQRKILVHDPFKAFCRDEAKKLARQQRVPIEVILNDKTFIQGCKDLWEIVV